MTDYLTRRKDAWLQYIANYRAAEKANVEAKQLEYDNSRIARRDAVDNMIDEILPAGQVVSETAIEQLRPLLEDALYHRSHCLKANKG